MRFNSMTVLREHLERIETQQLDAMLLEELRKEYPNGELIRMSGSVLRERDREFIPELGANIQQAWERYQKQARSVHKKPKHINSWLVKAASLILVLFVLVSMLPQEAKAMNFFERFIVWTEDVFSLISPSEVQNRKEEYVFRTDNPGLQEVYDKVTELGVTIPVVPMWLPEGYELVECVLTAVPTKKYISATFSNGETNVVYQLDVYADNVTTKYYKDETAIRKEEFAGISHAIVKNKNLLIAVWSVENVECTICIDCQEAVLISVLKSIYKMEGN